MAARLRETLLRSRKPSVMRSIGFFNKLELRDFVKARPLHTRVGGSRYSLVSPDHAAFDGRFQGIPENLRAVLDNGGRLVVKHAYPMSTYGKFTYFLSKQDGQLHLHLPSTGERWRGLKAAVELRRLTDRRPSDAYAPHAEEPYRRQWMVEEAYQPARLDGRIVETRHFFTPFFGKQNWLLGGIGYLGHSDTRSVDTALAGNHRVVDIMKQLYMQSEYGGHSEKKAQELARHWDQAASGMLLTLSKRLHRNVSRQSRVPFASEGFKYAQLEKSPLWEGKTKEGKDLITLGHGFAGDSSPVWNPRTRRFDVALAEVQYWPEIKDFFEVHPEKRQELQTRFDALSAKRKAILSTPRRSTEYVPD
ncbi:hypothetical protein HY994_05910 [Candidatus Micrarchaeota archaeon]|nr:hypothetical protein [Candidatus Micrarchaeota archaeon]